MQDGLRPGAGGQFGGLVEQRPRIGGAALGGVQLTVGDRQDIRLAPRSMRRP
ncbi:hypothetical protein ACIF6L_09085 [Kitasatospora sp. NPDC086009]|uniref:hypothetical protein n=1 Tax=unclassified Kitasatospora TaxID=2633591 RepID=UPI0037C5AD0F